MKNNTNVVVATIFLLASCLFASFNAFADTYQVMTLISDNGINFYGMDDFGQVSFLQVGGGVPGTYYNFLNGSPTGTSLVAPSFVQDDGTLCSPVLPSGASAMVAKCNNGREAFSGYLTPGQVIPSIYEGPPFAQVAGFSGAGLFMNGNGDIVFNDPYNENWVEAFDLTTRAAPEPSSLVLLVTGILTAGRAFRRHPLKRNS